MVITELLSAPSSYYGPLDVVSVPGKGRGVIAQMALRSGDLLMCTPPLALVEQQDDTGPTPQAAAPCAADLARLLGRSRLSPQQTAVLEALYSGGQMCSGTGVGPGTGTTSAGAELQLPSLAPPHGQGLYGGTPDMAADGAGGSEQAQPGPGGQGSELPDPRAARYLGAVVYNCYSEPSADPLLDLLLAGGEQQGAAAGGGLVGLYADFAMLNHSCCPNTINLVGGPHRHMVVRATEDIAERGEVTVCYFGRELLAPRSVRAEATQRTHAFRCRCPRCTYEESLGPEAEAAVQAVYDNVNGEWGPRVGELAAALDDLMGGAGSGGGRGAPPPPAVLAGILQELRGLDATVGAAVAEAEERAGACARSPEAGDEGEQASASVRRRQQLWLRASMYDALELRVVIADVIWDALGAPVAAAAAAAGRAAGSSGAAIGAAAVELHQRRVDAQEACLEVVAGVAPGTNLHLQLAAQSEQLARRGAALGLAGRAPPPAGPPGAPSAAATPKGLWGALSGLLPGQKPAAGAQQSTGQPGGQRPNISAGGDDRSDDGGEGTRQGPWPLDSALGVRYGRLTGGQVALLRKAFLEDEH